MDLIRDGGQRVISHAFGINTLPFTTQILSRTIFFHIHPHLNNLLLWYFVTLPFFLHLFIFFSFFSNRTESKLASMNAWMGEWQRSWGRVHFVKNLKRQHYNWFLWLKDCRDVSSLFLNLAPCVSFPSLFVCILVKCKKGNKGHARMKKKVISMDSGLDF